MRTGPALAFAALLAALPAAAAPATYSATFTETRTITGMQQPLVLHGSVEFRPGRSLDWSIDKPYRYSLVVHDGRIEERLPDGSTQSGRLAAKPWAEALFDLFSALFGGDTRALARYFEVTPGADGFTLVPRGKTLAQAVKRVVVKGRPLPHSVSIEESDGSLTRLAFEMHSPLPQTARAAAAASGG